MEKLRTIYHSFLENPHLSACLIFEENEYQGILLKKDLERRLRDDENFIHDLIINVPKDGIEDIIFNDTPNIKMGIPYFDTRGCYLGVLLYDEFVAEFFPEDFQTKLSHREIIDYFEHPAFIVNQFKTILYINKEGESLLSAKAFGQKIPNMLLSFEITMDKDKMQVLRNGQTWTLFISKSQTPFALYYIYQFIKNKTLA